jgi:hypothetical protein
VSVATFERREVVRACVSNGMTAAGTSTDCSLRLGLPPRPLLLRIAERAAYQRRLFGTRQRLYDHRERLQLRFKRLSSA